MSQARISPVQRMLAQTITNQAARYSYSKHNSDWHNCKLCPLGYQPQLRHHVFFRGTLPCNTLFIGEAPGDSENITGLPFMNPQAAGGVFDTIIHNCLALCPLMTWAVTNSVLCIPLTPDGKKFREPKRAEVEACSPRLVEFIQIAQPSLIVAMGKVAQMSLLGITMPTSFQMRVNTAHPSWMQRDKIDTDLEIKRSVLSITSAFKKLEQ